MKSTSILFSVLALFLATQAHADPLGGPLSPGSSCKDIYNSGVTTSGYYFLSTNGNYFAAYCDMTTSNNAGWMLVAFADSGNFTSGLNVTNSSGNTSTRRGVSVVMNLANLMSGASKIAFSWTSPGDSTSYPTGDITSYTNAFSIPAPTSMNFNMTANPAYNNATSGSVSGAFSTCSGGTYDYIALTNLVGTPVGGSDNQLPENMTYRSQTFGINCNSSGCNNYGFSFPNEILYYDMLDGGTGACSTMDFTAAQLEGSGSCGIGCGGSGFYLGNGSNGQLITNPVGSETTYTSNSVSFNTVAIWLLI